jgi:predicted phosphodiesterase
VVDNHSRLEPNKKDSIELETLVRIIPWYLEQRLKDNKRIKILYNTFADDIISFKVFDFNIVAVHGHKDSPAKVINNMIAATRQRNDLVLTAHLHHFSSDEEQECLRISNGSLMGVDTYAQDLRLHSKASQNFIVVGKDNVAKAIYKINLN